MIRASGLVRTATRSVTVAIGKPPSVSIVSRCFLGIRSLSASNALRVLAFALAAIAGFLDAVGYLTLHHVFVAHMTGNASKLGVALAHGHLTKAAALALAPLVFVAAIAAGTALLDAGAQHLVLGGEALLVAAFMVYGSRGGSFYVLLAVAVAALGFQTAALTSIDGETVRTTYVSGMLTRLGQSLVRRSGRRVFLTAIWACYVGGAIGGAAALRGLSLWCLAIPLGALLAATAVSARCRFSAAR
jgi:uncharacterized membrane protein YoaK (UPF0700 family)